MPSERLGLRAWLEQKIDNCEFPGVEWLDRSRGTFVIPWKHASRHGWEQNQDAALFKAWAIYTGRYVEGEKPEPKTWKANFRCAVNALPDISIVKGKGQCKGKNAHRVFVFTRKRKSKMYVSSRNPGIKMSSMDKNQVNSQDDEESMAAEKRYNTRPPKQTHVRIKEEPYDEGYNLQNGGSCYHNNYSPMTKRIKLEHDEIKEETKEFITEKRQPGLYSLSEILKIIPQIQMGRMSSPQMQHNQQTQPAYYTPSLFEEKMDDEEFNRLARDVSDSENGFDDDFNEILYHAQTADSTSDASDIEELAMQEIFDDSKSYRSSVSDDDLQNVFVPENHQEMYQPMGGQFHNMNLLSSFLPNVWNDPFLGSVQQQTPPDMIGVLAQALRQELL